MTRPRPLRLAAIGCGGRSLTYTELAAGRPEWFQVVAAADPKSHRVERIREVSHNAGFLAFSSDREILEGPQLADVMIIGTQDSFHVSPCLAAMRKGYDVLLEKPVSPKPEEVMMLAREAERLGRRVMVCHVLRYTPFYEKVKALLDTGRIGCPVAFHLSEGVGPWHQAHSYVRGHWAKRAGASPMILAKSCHDMDILSWLVDRPCRSVASFGDLSFFTPRNRPPGAPGRCTEGCPAGDGCPYNALHYLDRHRKWLGHVMDGAEQASENEIRDWLHVNPWGRCVYACDNDVVDRQVLALSFEDAVSATFTMTAFDTGRNLEIMGTEGVLRGGEFLRKHRGYDLIVEPHHGGTPESIRLNETEGGYAGHMGGDSGLISQLYHEMRTAAPGEMKSSLSRSVESHLMAFAADRSRLEKRMVDLEEFRSLELPPVTDRLGSLPESGLTSL